MDQKISVDHFVPWQYVAHDELWNLHPTTKSINSSKSNNLPVWDMYFSQLAGLEYQSYKLSKENDVVKGAFDNIAKYHLNTSRNWLIFSKLSMLRQRQGDIASKIWSVSEKKKQISAEAKEADPLIYVEVENKEQSIKNTSASEVASIVEYIRVNKEKSIGIIIPFVNQKR